MDSVVSKLTRMPIGFGPATGPRRGPDGRRFDCLDSPVSVALSVSFRSNPGQLADLLPDRFELDGEPIVTVTATYMKNIEWLAGRGYNMLGVTIPASFRGDKDTVRGPFLTVLWENLADPIITGREELGFVKIYCELPEAVITDSSAQCTADWLGFEFMSLNIRGLKPVTDPTSTVHAGIDGLLHYKYLPRTGEWGEADASYAVMTPASTPNRKITAQWVGNGAVEWSHARWEDMPTQYMIVNALAELDVEEFINASITKTTGGKDLGDQRIIR